MVDVGILQLKINKMKKIIFILSLFLLSCNENRILTEPINIDDKHYTVIKIESFNEKSSEYHLSTKVDYVFFMDDISIVDINGKFKIGDTIKLKPITHTKTN